jgi:hypothetical protein
MVKDYHEGTDCFVVGKEDENSFSIITVHIWRMVQVLSFLVTLRNEDIVYLVIQHTIVQVLK